MARDTLGRPAAITNGLTKNVHSALVVGLAIGDGPPAEITVVGSAGVLANLRTSLLDLVDSGGCR
ncbi:hypothetical protein [Amycolatopsis sulphurea]|uniref:hypothetical protein n=1 Tax=Amycolatopsis sulphurea TaxID=76022 RepID=UPI001145AE84|nr:hypothetical protein [Amycolatopsis sulphurea]